MQQHTSPGEVPVPPNENLLTPVWTHERERPNHSVLAHRPEGGAFVDLTAVEVAQKVRRIAAGIMASGIEPGARICLFSPTRIEFTLLSYGIWAAGCAVVTIYDSSSADQVEWIVSDSQAVGIVCADDQLQKTFDEKAGQVESCEHVWVLDDGGMDDLIAAGAEITDEQVMERAQSIGHDSLACLIYTSGTTGRPKGCVLSVHNYVWTARQVQSILDEVLNADGVTLLFLPLAHSFASIVQVSAVMAANKIAFSTGIPQLTEEMAMVRPTWMFSVPRVFEKIYNTAMQKAHADGKGRIFDHAAKVATLQSRQAATGSVRLPVRLQYALFDRLVYAKLRDVFGGRCSYAVSGGAALGERLGHFFNGVGITVLEGYGLTETTAASTVNRPGEAKIGTVGPPLPGVTAAIADDSEILLSGSHIFGGYWNNDQATAETIVDGWFRTGDLGALDEDGWLSITGRKKELIVTAGGKNVAPAVLEDRVRAHPLVSQCMVVGDGRPFVGAVLTVDPDQWSHWAEENDVHGDLREHLDDPRLLDDLQEAIDHANKAVSKAESIRAFKVMPVDFTVEGGELTPTLKLKRRVVNDRYEEQIASLYGG